MAAVALAAHVRRPPPWSVAVGKLAGDDPRAGDIAVVSALAAWRQERGIYRLGPELAEALPGTDLHGDLPVDVLYRLAEAGAHGRRPSALESSISTRARRRCGDQVRRGRPDGSGARLTGVSGRGSRYGAVASSSSLSFARSTLNACASAAKSSALISGRHRKVNTTSQPSPLGMTRIGL